MSKLYNDHLTANLLASEVNSHPLQMDTIRSKIPSVKELECRIDNCRLVESNALDEVWPQIYIGNMVTAHNKEELSQHGITHIMNAAHGAWGSRGNQTFYGSEISYCGIAAEDSVDFDLSVYFHQASKYIHQALGAPKGKILVHCILGKSRSPALVLAYLMIYQNLSLADALERLLQYRAVSPNRGFLKQLQDLDLELRCKKALCRLL